jgi:hyperosmotically inducible periplasmic protein
VGAGDTLVGAVTSLLGVKMADAITSDRLLTCSRSARFSGARSLRRGEAEGRLAARRNSNLLEFLKGRNMKKLRLSVAMLTLLAIGTLAGCSGTAASPDVSNSIRKSLDQAGFKDVSVSQDRDKGIVTLGGQVATENDKSHAESLAKSFAGAQVVADQIAVIPVGVEKEAKAVNSDLDEGIEKNLDAALIQNKMHDNVKYEVKSGVVTLTGEVNSQYQRDHAEKVATRVPNVKQVVNDLQVKNQKASSSSQ